MTRAGRVGIANFIMRGKQYLAAIRPDGPVLALETMFFADELRDPSEELDGLPNGQSFSERELKMAQSLIDSMTVEWKAENYEDTYHDRVMELIEAKRRGEGVVSETEPTETGNVVDLMQALERSLESAKGARKGGGDGQARKRAGDGPTSKGAGRPDDLEKMSKDDLYQRAQDLQIPGRSKMTRRDIVAALRRAASREDPSAHAS